MFEIDEYAIYRRDVCQIKEIKYDDLNDREYYVLIPINDKSLTIEYPTENKSKLLRKLITKKEVENIIEEIPNIEIITQNNRLIEHEYKELLKTGKHTDLIKIIKTTYLRNDNRIAQGKKTTEKDSLYFNLAEKALYTEFSIVLNMDYDTTKKYVLDKVNNMA